ncbi:MAG TPA: tRNA lysidine(34) synthetase TilS [Gammaproteobacteria bacterium]|nr:tRNA lysidine(34) synthetase TilS [Gammaproteobacteria bacterium]
MAQRLQAHLPAARLLVAYSGGRDSHVLLHALASVRDGLPPLAAVHIDHGLQATSAAWAAHCRQVCQALGVDYLGRQVTVRAAPGESPEAAARRARYRALRQCVEQGTLLLTAHHRDDQAETLLLQLLRGAGPHGLAAMPEAAAFGDGLHLRPLLDYSRAQLARYAAGQMLHWIDDPSNEDTRFDRNHLRHALIPGIAERWPGAGRALARAAGHQAEAAALLDQLAAGDLVQAAGTTPGTLSIASLLTMDGPRRRNLLRYWLKEKGLPLPNAARLLHIEQNVLRARADAEPLVHWPGAEVRRYRDALYAGPPLPPIDPEFAVEWSLTGPLILPDGTRLRARRGEGEGIRLACCPGGRVTVRYRRGGERCRPAGRGGTRPLKKLLQEQGVPPWARERLPLLYHGAALLAVAGVLVCEPAGAAPSEPGGVIVREGGGWP